MKSYVLILIALIFGCTHSELSEKLTQVDELMNHQPDSAYTLIRGVNPNDLHSRADKAFYALLYTQAQYKNYIPLDTDSLINIAVDYYIKKPIKDRLPRSYMYKAAALSDMKQNKEAIEWLKKADMVADTTNYLMKGLINSQMGLLYSRNFVINNEDLKKYKVALKYYRLARHKMFENYTLSSIGNLYRISNTDSALSYLRQGIKLSRELNDTVILLKNMSRLAQEYISAGKYQEGKNLSLAALKLSSIPPVTLLCGVATSYVKLGLIDSGKYYLRQIILTKNSGDSLFYYKAVTDIAIANADFETAYNTKVQSVKIVDRVISDARKDDLVAIEKQFDNRIIRERAKYFEAQNTIKSYLLVIITLVLTGVILAIFSALKRRTRIAKERVLTVEQLKQEIQYQNDKLRDLESKQVTYSENEDALKEIIANRVVIFKKLAGIKYEYGTRSELFLKKFDEIILNNQQGESNANQIISIANKLNHHLIDRIAQTEPKLNQKELLLLSMTSLEFKQLEMCIYLQSPSLDATYMARQRLAKKLKTKSLELYLAQFNNDCPVNSL